MRTGSTQTLRVEGLVVDRPGRRVLDGVSLAVTAGEAVALVGPSGSGKTTLLGCIAGLVPATSGDIVVAGATQYGRSRAGRRRAGIGMVFQSGELLPELTVLENVALPALFSERPDARARAGHQLALVGLSTVADRRPDRLSGGEVQRVAVARALVDAPELVLADEPTGALDEEAAQMVTALLIRACHEQGAALVMATHDPAVAATTDRTMVLSRGRLTAVEVDA